MEYKVKDVELGKLGTERINWAENQMPVLLKIRERFSREKPLGTRLGCCLHVTKETAVLIRTLRAGGAEISLCASNPLSTQDDVAAALVQEGVRIYAWRGESTSEYYWCIDQVLAGNPAILVDDGADLITTSHKKGNVAGVLGACEETTTGVVRLKALEREGLLKVPVVAVNNARSKNLFDNPLGTGQSALDGIIRSTNILIAGKEVVVIGFGQVGSGITERARGLGARVTVVEADPIKALRASMLGFRATALSEAASYGDIFITATGNINVVRREHLTKMKDNVILANAGHYDAEISKPDLESISSTRRRVGQNVEEYRLKDGRRLYLLAEGRLVNLVCAEGHPSDVMDLSFSIQAMSVEYIMKTHEKLPKAVIDVPSEIDESVARLKLLSMGMSTEVMTEEQTSYLSSWQLGTSDA